MTQIPPRSIDVPLSRLATSSPGATRVLHRYALDYCCGGATTLGDACAAAGVDPARVAEELEREQASGDGVDWTSRPAVDLIDHLLDAFHAHHREELPRLIAMAAKVEEVHAQRDGCPEGLAHHLGVMLHSLEDHMQKEEQVLFPMIRAGQGHSAAMPISCMEDEHEEHGRSLERLRELANGYEPPAGACTTWRALYLGLAALERDLMEHIHLENNVLFPSCAEAG